MHLRTTPSTGKVFATCAALATIPLLAVSTSIINTILRITCKHYFQYYFQCLQVVCPKNGKMAKMETYRDEVSRENILLLLVPK